MITKPRLLTLAAALLSLVHVQTLNAQNLTWTTIGGTITEGNGTWTTGSAGWWTGAANATWTSGSNATFGGGTAGTAGTVTLGGNITANKITFNAPFEGNYTLNLAGNTLFTPNVIGAITSNANTTTTINSAGTGGWNISNNGTTQTISSSGLVTVNAKVTGSGNMYVGGTGSVILNNDTNSFAGLLGRQNAGDLTISSIKNIGVASAAGAGNTVRLGASGTIIYNGSGDSTNRTLELFGIGSATLNNNGSGALVWTGPITHTSTGNKTFTLGGSNTANNELQGALIDNGTNVLSVTKADAGTWVLSGNNSYNGLTTVSNGTLTLSGNNSGAGGVTITGGTLTLSGNNSGTGAVTLTDGTLNINSAAALGASASALNISGGTIDNTSGSAKTLVNNNPITLDGSFAYGTSAGTSANNLNLGTGAVNIGGGGRTITLNGAGALTFGGVLTNTNVGSGSSLTVNNGTGTTSTSAVSFGGVSMTASTDGSGNRNFSFFGNGNVNITGAMVNGAGNGTTGALVWSNTGTLTLTGVNTYTGGTTINSGVLDAIDGTGLSSNSSLAIRGGVFQSSGNFTRSLGSLVNWSDNNGGFAARGGVLNLQFGNGTSSVTWGTANNQVAGDGKSLIFGSSTADNRVDFQNGLNLGNGAVATRTITVIDNPDSSADIARISGNITETTAGMGLLKDGNGTLELTGNNSYTGTTTINEGTLIINGNNTAANGAVAVASGATLGGTGTIGGATTVNGTLSPGDNGPGVLKFASSLTLTSTADTLMNLNGTVRGSGYDGIDVTGAMAYNGSLLLNFGSSFLSDGATFSLFNAGSATTGLTSVAFSGAYGVGSFDNNGSGNWSYNSGGSAWAFSESNGQLTITTAVPEPSTWALLGVCLGIFLVMRRRHCRPRLELERHGQ